MVIDNGFDVIGPILQYSTGNKWWETRQVTVGQPNVSTTYHTTTLISLYICCHSNLHNKHRRHHHTIDISMVYGWTNI